MMTPMRYITGLLLIGGLLLAGCQTNRPMGEIAAVVDSIKLTSSNGDRGVVTLRYGNENIIPISFAKSSHVLLLNGTKVADIDNPSPLGLAPLTTTTRDFKVEFTNPSLMLQLEHRQAGYRLESKVLTEVGNRREKSSSTTSGHVTVDVATK